MLALAELCDKYCDINRYLVSYEANIYGELFKRLLFNYIEDNNPKNFDESVLVKYYTDDKLTKFNYGVKMTTASKTKCCRFFKMQYESGKIENNSTIFLNEIQLFCDNKGNGTYQASFGHDDAVMSQMQIILVQDTLQYRELVELCNSGLVQQETTSFNFFEEYADYSTMDADKNFYNRLNGRF